MLTLHDIAHRATGPPQSSTGVVPYNGFDWLPNRSTGRSLSTTILGARGSGKSLPTFKELSWGDLNAGIPQLILDPVGSSSYLLDKVWRARDTMPENAWWRLAKKIVYLDFGGAGGKTPEWPLLFRRTGESHYIAAQRPIDLIAGLDPNLASASVEGLNAIREVGSNTFLILSVLGFQLTEAEVLLTQPKQCEKWGWFDEALQREPIEAAPAVRFFQKQFMKWKPDIRDRRTKSLLNQLQMLQLDPHMRAMFGSSQVPDWQKWETEGMCVIADFQGIRDLTRRRFCMMAVYDQFLSYKLSQGLRSPPWSLILEELTQWIPDGAMGEVMTSKLDSLLNVFARNYQIYVTTISQELFQMPPRLQEVLLAAGNIMIGNQASVEGRKRLAEYFFPYASQGIPPKRLEKVYRGEEVVDYRPIEYSYLEYAAAAQEAFQLQGWHFWVKAARKEGDSSGGLRPMVVQRNRGEWVQEAEVSIFKQLLRGWSSRTQQDIFAEIEGRLGMLGSQAEYDVAIASGGNHQPTEQPNEEMETESSIPELPPGVEVISGGFLPGRVSQ